MHAPRNIIKPADVTPPATFHVDITWLLDEAGPSQGTPTDQAQ